MNILKATTYHKCKRGHDIWSGDQYYPQRRNKVLCLDCGKPKAAKSFIVRLLNKIK